ncbi:MAG: cell division protein FtsZ [Candidatus Aminicenantes bacterium]|jgi:cell division protein FtsZ
MQEDIKITYAKEKKKGAVLKVIGVGGGGGNAVNRMIEEGMTGVEFVAINTDVQDLSNIKPSAISLQIGEKITKGLGVGSNAELGMQAALENTEAIIEILEGAHMAFITAGMGGGTGTGASQVIANHASSMGILTVAIVTKPFEFEGSQRMQVAETGIKSLAESVDALLVIPNQKLFEIEDANISYKDAYKKVDEILLKAVRGISDIINNAGYQNVDFADVKACMSEKGRTLMGTGEAKGENRAEEAVKKALTSPLLDNVSIEGATGILYNITAASDLSLREIGVIADMIKSHASPEAKIKFGIVDDETIRDVLRVTVIATGFKEGAKRLTPRGLHKMNTPPQPQAPGKSSIIEDYQPQNNHPGYYLGKTVNPTKSPPPAPSPAPSAGTNLDGYINEGSIPSMLQDPESVDDLLDVPSFQRQRITGRNDKWK